MCFTHTPAKAILKKNPKNAASKTKPKGVSTNMRAPDKNTKSFLAKTKKSLTKNKQKGPAAASAAAKSKGAAGADAVASPVTKGT